MGRLIDGTVIIIVKSIRNTKNTNSENERFEKHKTVLSDYCPHCGYKMDVKERV